MNNLLVAIEYASHYLRSRGWTIDSASGCWTHPKHVEQYASIWRAMAAEEGE